MNPHAALTAGNVAVITGAADGIGLAAARRFAGQGLHVVLADIDGKKLAAAVEDVRHAADDNVDIVGQVVDVADYASVEALRQRAFEQFGHVDVLMNNAGRSGRTGAWEALDTWHAIIDVNLWGIVNGLQAFTPAMIEQNRPAVIINTGSKQGITNPPGNPAYNVSKAGVKAATESLQHALRNTEDCQVSAHLLVPGYTYTGLTRARGVDEKPAGAWTADQVVDYLVDSINCGRFYIICPDNEVSSEDDAKRILWAAGDMVHDRTPLSRWDPAYADAFVEFEP